MVDADREPPEVFISYSTEDEKQANEVLERLESKNIRCWIAPRDIQPGSNYGESIEVAIAAARVFVVILSPSSNLSEFVRREIEIAVNNRAPIIPFRIEAFQLSGAMRFFLAAIQMLDAFAEPREMQLEVLAETVGLILRRRPMEPAPLSSPPRPSSPPVPPRRNPRWVWASIAIAIVASLIATVLIYRATVARTVAAIDPCDPFSQPESQPAMPAEFPAADAEHPLLPPDPKKSTSAVVIRNETGKQLRIWRHVYRPKGSPERDSWRMWLVCKNSAPPPSSMAGWTYFVVEDLDDVSDKSRISYYEVGWRFLDYDRNASIRLRPGFFERPDSPETFLIDYPR